MASISTSRVAKRNLQACDNCRRKKIKCPGERPKCSSCLRLSQPCRYKFSALSHQQDNCEPSAHLAQRLAQLEERVDSLAESSRTARTPHSLSNNTIYNPPCDQNGTSLCLPTKDAIASAIEVYFRCCHRQPLWLLDPEHATDDDNWSEDLLCPVLAFASHCAPRSSSDRSLSDAASHSDRARKAIMAKIAQGDVSFQTMQGLCLLSYYNYTVQDLHLARLHAGLAQSLLQSSGLSQQINSNSVPNLQAQRKLFWSIQLLDQLYGLPMMSICIINESRIPHFSSEQFGSNRQLAAPCPLFPSDDLECHDVDSPGIWGHFVKMTSVWKDVRAYVAECAEGRNTSPWASGSTYASILSALNDDECSFPSEYRYCNNNFPQQTPEQLEQRRSYWLVWFNIQITYHTIQSTLNHSFIYSQKASNHKRGSNMFWKTSLEQALIHSVWISRLFDLASKGNLRLYDPHFARCAAIAATLHLYHSRTADSSINSGAITNLESCRTIIDQLAGTWPTCQHIKNALDKLIEQASWTSEAASGSDQIALNTELMWSILGYSTSSAVSHTSSLFRSNFPAVIADFERHENTNIDQVSCEGTVEELCGLGSNVAVSPTWYSTVPAGSRIAARHEIQSVQEHNVQQNDMINSGDLDHPLPALQWSENEDINTLMDINYDLFNQLLDTDYSSSGRWDLGTF